MRVFLISILLITCIQADNTDSKYIDLLPDKEKQEFLDKIARRILDEVQTKDDRPKESSEIPEEQLNEHDAIIQKIMKEESENLRRQTNKTTVQSDDINKIGNVLRKEHEQSVGYVDLTLRSDKNRTKREGERRVFTGFSPDNDNSTEHASKESDVDIQVKNFRRRVNVDERIVADENNVTTKTDDHENIEENKSPTKDENIKTGDTAQYTVNQQETKVTTRDNLNASDKTDSNNEIEKTTEYNDNQVNTQLTTENSVLSISTDLTETVSNPVQQEEVQKLHESINYGNSKNTLNDSARTSVEATKNSNITDKLLRSTVEISTLDFVPNKTIIKQLQDSDVINIEIATVQATKDIFLTTIKYDENKFENNAGSKVHTTTEETTLLTPSTLESKAHSTSKDNNKSVARTVHSKRDEVEKKPNQLKKNRNKIKMTKASKIFVNDVIKTLRLKLLNGNIKRENINYKTPYSVKKKHMEHKLFEISPDVSPFVKQKPIKYQSLQVNIKQRKISHPDREQPAVLEQPYHVPIYNYLSNNAFYNSHNVFGPNPESTDDNEEYVIKNDEGYKFPSFMPQSAMKLKQNKKPNTEEQPFEVPVYYYSPKNAYYNPKNYHGPNFPDSNEKQDENYNDYDNTSYEIDKHDEANKKREQIEWQYYYDPHIRVQNGEKSTKKKNNKGELFEVNLPKSVIDFILKETTIDLKGYIHANYGNQEKRLLRCCSYKNKCKNCNFEPASEEKDLREYAYADPVKEIPLQDNMSKIRNMMFEKKHFMLLKPSNVSQFDEYFQEKSLNDSQNTLRASSSPISLHGLLKRVKPKLNALDHETRYDETLTGTEKNVNSKNPIKLIYYKNPNRKKRPNYGVGKLVNTPLQKILEIYKKPRKELENNNKGLRGFVEKYNGKKLENADKPILRYAKDDKTTEYNMIKEITDFIRDQEIMDLYLKLEKMEQEERKKKKAKIQTARDGKSKDDVIVFVEVLGNMINEHNKALEQYDWLGSAVDVLSAVNKMVFMVIEVQNDEDIHPSDLELLKYIVYLHTHAKDVITEESPNKQMRGQIIPRGIKQNQLVREAGLNREWPLKTRQRSNDILQNDLDSLLTFLEDLQNALYDLDTALKYISMVTEYKNQRWFESLNQVHIDSNRKQLLELLLHLCTTRLLGLVEQSAKNGLVDNFTDYIKRNEKEIENTIEEFAFVLKLLEEIKDIK